MSDAMLAQPALPGEKPAHRHRIACAAVLALAATLLFWRLGAVYLWQDEAVTAVLGERLMRYGKPLAWDGRNLIALDNFGAEKRTGAPPANPEATIRSAVARGDFKADTTWTFHPWGQFAAAGVSLALLGHGTWQARFPFALAALLTVVLLYAYAMRVFRDRTVAFLAALLLTLNGVWVLHARQCRYYALSSLALLLCAMAYGRWQRGERFGAAAFVAAGVFYFHTDFGSFFPSMAVLGILALAAARPGPLATLRVFGVLAALVAPFAWFYGIAGRTIASAETPGHKFVRTLFNLNGFTVSFVIVAAALWLLRREWHRLHRLQRDALLTPALLVFAMLAWVPAVAGFAFHRYVVHLTPLTSLLSAWALVRVASLAVARWRTSVLVALAAVTSASGALAWPVAVPIVQAEGDSAGTVLAGSLLSPALRQILSEVFLPRPDPNRAAVEFLQSRLRPGDEVLANYEDIPLMFYTQARIRGGIAAFRVGDAPPARFLILRRSVPFVFWSAFVREASRWEWRFTQLDAPDVPFGNNPDPVADSFAPAGPLVVGELVGEAAGTRAASWPGK